MAAPPIPEFPVRDLKLEALARLQAHGADGRELRLARQGEVSSLSAQRQTYHAHLRFDVHDPGCVKTRGDERRLVAVRHF